MMIRLRTLGSIELHSTDGEPLDAVIAQPKRLALLAYLALARPFGFHRRDRLFAMFWPEQDESRARDSLNQAIRFLRQALGSSVVVSRGAEDVGLDPAQLWCDALAFQAAVDDGRPREAIELYRGDLLTGFFVADSHGFEEWLEAERGRLREEASNAARVVAEAEEAAGNLTQALRMGRLEFGLSNGDERALRRWLAMLARAGDRAGAIQAYEDFARRLRDAYEADPSPETQGLVETIRREVRKPAAAARPHIVAVRSPTAAEPLESTTAASTGVFTRGWYVVAREIGSGGMATVYLTHDVRHRRWVAMKVLRPEIALTIGVEGFLREIRIAAALQHPHIVPVFDSGATDGRLYFVMPFVEGESLRARLEREGPLPLGEALRITREVANGLAYAHKQGVVHRDIKPENILLTGEPGAPDSHAMIADFGIARAIATSGAEERLTQTGLVVGSPTYMSPEQAAGDVVDGRSDVYSLGCVLYEMLAGKPPFVGVSRLSILAKHSVASVPALTQSRADVTRPVQELVNRALAKAPIDRYDTAADFERAIRAVIPVSPTGGAVLRPKGPAQESAPFGPRRATVVLDALLVVTILGIATWAGLRERHTASSGTLPVVRSAGSADFDKRNLAVLYLEDLTPDHQFHYTAEGLTKALIQQLRAVSEVVVASPNVSAEFRRHVGVGIDSTARQLNIGTLLTGQVSSLGVGVRVDLKMLDALSEQVVATARVEQADRDWVQLQRSLAAAVTGLLRRRFDKSMRELESHPGTQNPLAWEAMQRADHEITQIDSLVRVRGGPVTLVHIARTDSMLKAVTALDDRWDEPLIERAALGDRAMRNGSTDSTRYDWVSAGFGPVERVLARSPDNLHAIRVRGTLRLLKSMQSAARSLPPPLLDSAERDLRFAVAKDPRDAAGWNALSALLLVRWERTESVKALENAMRVDPFLPELASTFNQRIVIATNIPWATELARWCGEGAHRFPDNYTFAECRLWLSGLPGAKPDTAGLWAIRDEYVRKSPPYLVQFSKLKGNILVGLALVRAGQPENGKALADAARGDSLIDPKRDLTYLAAIVYAQARDTVTSVRLVAEYIQAHPMSRDMFSSPGWWPFAPLFHVEKFRALVGLSNEH